MLTMAPSGREPAGLLDRLSDHHRSRFVVGHILGVYVLIGSVAVLVCVVWSRIVGQGEASLGVSIAVVVGTTWLALTAGWWSCRAQIRVIQRFVTRDDDSDDALRAQAFDAILGLPRRLAAATVARLAVPALVAVIMLFGVRRGHLDVKLSVFVVLGTLFMVMYGGVVGYAAGEYGWRPGREGAAGPLSREQFRRAPRISVGVRLLTGFTTALLVTSFIVAALAAPAGERTRAFERAFLISLLAAPALGLSVAVPLLRNILKPIQDLIVGTTRVARGDLEVQAAVTSIDEFGELAVSFNEMVAGLRDRRALREYNTRLVGELQASRARIVAAADAARRGSSATFTMGRSSGWSRSRRSSGWCSASSSATPRPRRGCWRSCTAGSGAWDLSAGAGERRSARRAQ